MDEKSNRRWASLALLSIIVPVSLLATLRLTGLQPEPPPKESITLDTSAWSTVRPSDYEILDQKYPLNTIATYHRIRIAFRITCLDGAKYHEIISPTELEVWTQ